MSTIGSRASPVSTERAPSATSSRSGASQVGSVTVTMARLLGSTAVDCPAWPPVGSLDPHVHGPVGLWTRPDRRRGDAVRTFQPKPADVQRAWHVVDADGAVLGRLAS